MFEPPYIDDYPEESSYSLEAIVQDLRKQGMPIDKIKNIAYDIEAQYAEITKTDKILNKILFGTWSIFLGFGSYYLTSAFMPDDHWEKTVLSVLVGTLVGIASYVKSLNLIEEHTQYLARILVPYTRKRDDTFLLQDQKTY